MRFDVTPAVRKRFADLRDDLVVPDRRARTGLDGSFSMPRVAHCKGTRLVVERTGFEPEIVALSVPSKRLSICLRRGQ